MLAGYCCLDLTDSDRYPVIKRSVAGVAEQTTHFGCELKREERKKERKDKGKEKKKNSSFTVSSVATIVLIKESFSYFWIILSFI